MFYKRTINTIQGTYGSHKSRLAGHIVSVLMGQNEIIGLRALDDYQVLYCDTERDVEDELPIEMQGIMNLSGTRKNLNYFSFYDVSRENRSEKLNELVDNVRIPEKHLIVFIDIVTDFITSFNNLEKTNKFIDFANKLSKDKDCSLFMVIHENPNKENKARGHIGTELVNKSNTALSITDEGDGLYKIKMLKQRRTKKLNNIFVKYSNDFNGLILVETIKDAVRKLPQKELAEFILSFMNKGTQFSQKEIINRIINRFDISERTARNGFYALKDDPTLLGLNFKLDLIKGKKNSNYFRLIKLEILL